MKVFTGVSGLQTFGGLFCHWSPHASAPADAYSVIVILLKHMTSPVFTCPYTFVLYGTAVCSLVGKLSGAKLEIIIKTPGGSDSTVAVDPLTVLEMNK